MIISNQTNQSYWYVLREEDENFVISNNDSSTPNNQFENPRYVIDVVGEQQCTSVATRDTLGVHDIVSSEKNKSKHESIWDRNRIQTLLIMCIENISKKPSEPANALWSEKHPIWANIATAVGTSPAECTRKFRNLRRTYVRLYKMKHANKETKWVHYDLCDELFKSYRPLQSLLKPWDENKVKRLLSLYLENIPKFKNPYFVHKHAWKEIAAELESTEYMCYHKFKNLKRTYITYKEKLNRFGAKQIKWPYYSYFEKLSFIQNPVKRPWDRNKIKILLESYASFAPKFKDPQYKKQQLWKEISDIVGESPGDCDKKFRNMKQTYIRLKTKSGDRVSNWKYFKLFEQIFHTNNITTLPILMKSGHLEEHVTQLLEFYLQNKEKFQNPLTNKRLLWRTIGRCIGMSADECSRKFRNLKQTYIRIADKRHSTGKHYSWPYYNIFEKIYDNITKSSHLEGNEHKNIDVKETAKNVEDNRENNKKFERLIKALEESNKIQRAKNQILEELLSACLNINNSVCKI